MGPGESKEKGVPQWPLFPRRTKKGPNTPGYDPEEEDLEGTRRPWPLSHTKEMKAIKRHGK